MIIDLNTNLPTFAQHILGYFGLKSMDDLFIETISEEDKAKFNLYPQFECLCDCGAQIDIFYRGFFDHFQSKEHDDCITFSPQLKHERGERADNIDVELSKDTLKELQNFLWSVEKAHSFKADFTSDVWCVLELHGDLGYNGFKIMVRGEKGNIKCYLYEVSEKMPQIPVIRPAENPRECLGFILELDGDPDSFEQGDGNFTKNPMTPAIMKWAKGLFELNGLGDKDIHFSWTRKYKYTSNKENESLPL